jgi:hypothetical protein
MKIWSGNRLKFTGIVKGYHFITAIIKADGSLSDVQGNKKDSSPNLELLDSLKSELQAWFIDLHNATQVNLSKLPIQAGRDRKDQLYININDKTFNFGARGQPDKEEALKRSGIQALIESRIEDKKLWDAIHDPELISRTKEQILTSLKEVVKESQAANENDIAKGLLPKGVEPREGAMVSQISQNNNNNDISKAV